MGYTHYWKFTGKVNNWGEFIEKVRTVLGNLPKHSTSSGGYYSNEPLFITGGTSREPEITDTYIRFNGVGVRPENLIPVQENGCTLYVPKDRKNNLGHETFYFAYKKKQYGFCKTDRKPYDLAVQACLILAKACFGDKIIVSSDGDLEDWESAVKFVAKFYPTDSLKFVLSEED